MTSTDLLSPAQFQEAAAVHLKPLGLTRKGNSRMWLDDHGWWLGIVDSAFEDSTSGLQMNIGVMWLWYDKDFISFDVNRRIEAKTKSLQSKDPARAADQLASQAAAAITQIREDFSSISKVADYLEHAEPPKSAAQHYHAGVAAGLVGRDANATAAFSEVIGSPDRDVWSNELQARTKELYGLAQNTAVFRSKITEIVIGARESLRLEPLESIVFGS